MNFSPAEQQLLIGLSRKSMCEAIQGRGIPEVSPDSLTPTMNEHAASFVTLHLGGKLRGCVGNLVASEPVFRSVMRNAVGAALRDNRFDPVTLDESTRLSVHLSILSPLSPLKFDTSNELLDQLPPGEVGVVLKQSGRTATYLPQVWDTFRGKREFLDSLCRKAGLDGLAWTRPGTDVLVYRISEFGDDNTG